MDKRRIFSGPKSVLGHDHGSIFIDVSGKKGKTLNATTEDILKAVVDNSFTNEVQEAIDSIHLSIHNEIKNLQASPKWKLK